MRKDDQRLKSGKDRRDDHLVVSIGHGDQAESPRVRGTAAADQRLRHAALVRTLQSPPAGALGSRAAGTAARPRCCRLNCRRLLLLDLFLSVDE